MQKIFSTIILNLIIIQFSIGQNKFLSGYLINSTNDTLNGSILFEDWTISPKSIIFKNEKNLEERYLAENLKSFTISELNLNYESQFSIVKYVSKEPISNYSKLFSEVDSSYFFFKTLLKSNYINLYSLSDSYEKDRYYIKKDGDFYELIKYSFYKYNINGKIFEYKNEDFKNQIKNLCGDAPNLKIEVPLYSENSLKNYFSKYNACFKDNNQVNFTSIKDSAIFSFGLLYGIENFSNFKSSLPFSNQNLGLSGMITLPKNHHNDFIKIQIDYAKNTYGKLEKSENKGVDWKSPSTEISVGFGKFMGGGNIQPFLSTSLNFFIMDYFNFKNVQYAKNNTIVYSVNIGVAYKKAIILEISKLATIFGKRDGLGPQISILVLPFK